MAHTDIKIIKTTSGEEIISFCEDSKTDPTIAILYYPMSIERTVKSSEKTEHGTTVSTQGIKLVSWMPTAKDNKVFMPKYAIVSVCLADDEFADKFCSVVDSMEEEKTEDPIVSDIDALLDEYYMDPKSFGRSRTSDGLPSPTKAEVRKVIDWLGNNGKVVVDSHDALDFDEDDAYNDMPQSSDQNDYSDFSDWQDREYDDAYLDGSVDTPQMPPQQPKWNPRDRWSA